MPVLHYVRLLSQNQPLPSFGGRDATDCDIVPVEAADRSAVAALAEACRRDDPLLAGRCAPAGLAAEVTSRDGRVVHAWLARPRSGGPMPEHAASPLGLVTLVVVGLGADRRFSIGWLLVHPASRRRGVGRALIGTALAAAGRQGAASVTVETLASWPAAVACWQAVGFEPVVQGT